MDVTCHCSTGPTGPFPLGRDGFASLDADGLHVHKLLHAEGRALPAQAGGLDPAKGQRGVAAHEVIHEAHASVQLLETLFSKLLQNGTWNQLSKTTSGFSRLIQNGT